MKNLAAILMCLCAIQAANPQIINSGRHRQVTIVVAGLTDTFAGTVGTLLSAHTSDSGNTWTQDWTTNCPATATLTGSSSLVSATGGACAGYTSNWTPPSADYTVQATCAVSGTGQCDLFSRAASNNKLTGYIVSFTGGTGVALYQFNAGTGGQLGSTYSGVTSGTHTISITTSGTTISVAVDGTTQITVTDSTFSAAGKVGVYLLNNTANAAIMSSLTAH